MFMHSIKYGRTCHLCKWLLTKEASKLKITSQIEKLAYEIELGIQIDKEDFMHDINQCEFKRDG